MTTVSAFLDQHFSSLDSLQATDLLIRSLEEENARLQQEVCVPQAVLIMKVNNIHANLHSVLPEVKEKTVMLEDLAKKYQTMKIDLDAKNLKTGSFQKTLQSLVEQEVLEDAILYLQVAERCAYLSEESEMALKLARAPGSNSEISEKDLTLALSPFFSLTQIRDDLSQFPCHNLLEFVNKKILGLSEPLADMLKEVFKSRLQGVFFLSSINSIPSCFLA